MFQEWGFLLGEIWGLLALAALAGLFAGWLIWGGRRAVVADTSANAEAVRLRTALDNAEVVKTADARRIAELEAGLDGAAEARAELVRLKAALDSCEAERGLAAGRLAALDAAAPAAATATPAPAPLLATGAPGASRPVSLDAARDGQPDDLKLIKGIGPVLEELCHKLGYYHFDQIANWTAEEIAWVDDNLEGFKGRVTRDGWVKQARDLAAGLPPLPGGEH